MTEVLNPRRQQQPSSSSDSPSRERPRPPALKTSHSALRSINRPPNVRRISNRVSIAEPEPQPEETQLKAETITSSVPKTPEPSHDNQPNHNFTNPSPTLATTANPIAHTASTLKIAQTLHSSLSSRLQLHVTTTPWATRNILTLDGGGIKGYSSLILLRTLMQEIAALEQSLSPPAFCSADPTGNENYYFTKSDDEEDRHFCSGVETEMEMLDCEKRAGKLRDMHMRGKGKVKVGELKVDVPPETMRKGEYLPSHYFDYIAGTSVGGLIAIMLGVMGRTVEGCLEEFRNGGEGRSRRDGRGLPVLFLEMEEDAAAEEEEEKKQVDVGDGGSQSQKREESSSRAEGRRRRVISFPGLSGTFEIPLPGFHGGADREKDKRRTTWPTKKSRAWFDTFAKFSVTSTDLTGSGNNTAASRAIVSDSEDISPTTQRANTNNTVASSCSSTTTSSPTSSISFKKTSFQCQTLAWCSEIDAATPTERQPYAFCTYEEVLVADGSDEEGKVPSIPEVAKAITTPSDSSQFKPFKLPAIGQFVDGSKEIRDPTLPVLKEISSLLGVDPSTPSSVPDTSNPPIDLLLSLGTDEHNAWFYEKLVQPFSSRSSPSEYSSSMSPSTTSSNSPSPTSSPSASTTSPSPSAPALEELRNSKGHLYTHYHRFQVSPLSLSPFPFSFSSLHAPFRRRHRTTNNHHLDEIEQATERWLSANNGEQRRLLKKYAEVLVRKRRARSATTRWETFALGARYFCWVEGCERNPSETHKGKGQGKEKGKGYGDVSGGGRGKDGDGNRERESREGRKEGQEGEEGEGEGKGEGDKGFDTRGDFWDHLNGRHGLLSKKGAREVEDELDKGRRFGFE
ncbi:uncharacterized protein B0T23DRAFT_380985 [Neurospora hispaniola]|uniref:PNPLA domain-containing protein n=1 Tax=Neurospora hispaniola TaxID=588809 RepID=A0AAJ0MRT9_9PEZI|nr:hypothetical protein B0T23DRAFT_380985 [Neurospora hispaniola]